MFLCGSLTGCCDPNCIPRKLFQSEQQKLMRKYGRYCVNNRRSSIIIENNLQVILMGARAMSTRKQNCWNVLMMTIVVLKLLSQQKCLSLPIVSQEALACSIYPIAPQNLRFADSNLFSTLQNCSFSPSTSSSKAFPSEWTPSLSNPSNDSPGNQCTYFDHNRFFGSPNSLMGYNPPIHLSLL